MITLKQVSPFHYAFRMAYTVSRASLAIYTLHALKTEPARLLRNNWMNPMSLKGSVATSLSRVIVCSTTDSDSGLSFPSLMAFTASKAKLAVCTSHIHKAETVQLSYNNWRNLRILKEFVTTPFSEVDQLI